MCAYRGSMVGAAVVAAGMLVVSPIAAADPEVPGFVVQEYASVDTPGGLAFDPGGSLYVGNLNTRTMSIHRVGLGGAPVEDFGPPLFDPDAVAFDAGGDISGIPGAVLVGGGTGPGGPPPSGYVVAIAPDESTTYLFGSPTEVFRNPSVMKLDKSGRLVFTDPRSSTRGFVVASANNTAIPLYDYGGPYIGLAVDSANRLYTCNKTGREVQIHNSDGTLVDPLFATYSSVINVLDFGPPRPAWGGHLYGASVGTGELLRIDRSGAVEVIGSGFSHPVALTFGPHDERLYISDFGTEKIYQVTPIDRPYDVGIDIRPFDERNLLDPMSPMLVSVAILSDEGFDALQTNLQTIRLEPGGATPGNYRVYDANRDRIPDLVPVVRARDIWIGCGETEVEITGQTYDGQEFHGVDIVSNRRCPR